MAKNVKVFPGFLIDPVSRTITPVQYQDRLEKYYHLLDCSMIEHVRIDQGGGDFLVADEEGLLHDPKHFFIIGSYPQPIAGKALLVGGMNRKGRVPLLTLEWLKQHVRWIPITGPEINVIRRPRVVVFEVSPNANPAEALKTTPPKIVNFGVCRFAIFTPEHYRDDGTCMCDDAEHREMMIKLWGYSASDFQGIPLREKGK